MNEKNTKETRSFRDPMASKIEAAQKRKAALESEYPRVADVYDAFYVRLDTLSQEGVRYLLGAEGIIGSELQVEAQSGFLLSGHGQRLAQLPEEALERLGRCFSEHWSIKALVCATFFRSQDKRASAEIALICWAPLDTVHHEALSNFSHNIAERLASGDRASLELSQEHFIDVLRSGGEWYLTKTTKREPLEKGTIVYKSRRSGTEKLTGFALKHRTGCNALATIFWILLVAGILALVWNLFFR